MSRPAGHDESYHAALASPTRREVLETLLRSPEPLDAGAVADRLGLHVTTARFHLDQLAEAGLARRSSGAERRRGRPRVLFGPTGAVRDEDSREQLIEVLASTVGRDGDREEESLSAGRRWADDLGGPDADDPATGLVEVLDRLGFAPRTDADTRTIRLLGCPFRAAAREHPDVVCTVHRGLVERMLEGTGPGSRLIPFAEPELCLVTLGDPAAP